MAIHPDYPGLHAEVVVGSESLKEYDDDGESQPKVITKYVEVNSNAHFGVRYTIPRGLSGNFGVRTNLNIDGIATCSFTHGYEKINHRNVHNCFELAYSNVDGLTYTHKFRFSQLHIDENNGSDEEHIRQQLTNVGVLTLTFRFIESRTERKPSRKGSRETPPKKAGNEFLRLSELDSVAEKSMKGDAKSHQASLDEAQLVGAYQPKISGYINKTGEPFAIFHFKYRSFPALQSLHIVPRSSSPSAESLMQSQRILGNKNKEEPVAMAQSQKGHDIVKQDAKRKTKTGIKREAVGRLKSESEVEIVGSKRLKCLPNRSDEVIVLD